MSGSEAEKPAPDLELDDQIKLVLDALSARLEVPAMPLWGYRTIGVGVIILAASASALAWGGDHFLVTVLASVGVFAGLAVIAAPLAYWSTLRRDAESSASQRRDLTVRALSKDKAQTSWDLARLKLESYVDRNLSQVRAIFWLASGVMVAGFVLIAWSIAVFSLDQADGAQAGALPAWISAASGVLVEFIGATLMAIYRSTMRQAGGFIRVLERINAVGMSIQILESVEGDAALKNEALVSVAKQLLVLYDDARPGLGLEPPSAPQPLEPPPGDVHIG